MPLDVTPTQTFCRLHAPALVCPLGDDLETIASRLFSGTRGLVLSDEHSPGRPLWLGAVTSPLPDDSDWPARHRSRNNRLLDAAFERLSPLLDAYLETHPQARLGIVLGTSTSGIGETERAVAQRAETATGLKTFTTLATRSARRPTSWPGVSPTLGQTSLSSLPTPSRPPAPPVPRP